MTTAAETWAALLDLLGALAGQYRADFQRAVVEAGLAREPVGVLLHAGDIDPRPLAAADLLRCVPYYAEVAFTAPLSRLVAGGWLEPAGEGTYRLTRKGRAATHRMYAAARDRLAALSPLPLADLDRLAQLLTRLLAACRANPAVADQACLAACGSAGPFVEPTALATTARVLEAMMNFRCDAHRTAWRPTGVDGPTWETLTWLWEGRADSAASLFAWSQKQPHPRAWGAADYGACLGTLAGRGWAELAAADRYRLTDAGRRLRQGIEDETNALFYGPWSVLSPAEIDELHARARAVVQGLAGP